MDKKLEQAYNEMVGISIVNIFSLSDEFGSVNFGKFDIDDIEHQYLLYIAMTSYSIHKHPIGFDLPRWERKAIAKKFGYPEIIDWKTRAKKKHCFNTNEVLNYMRPVGAEMTGDECFYFGDIYNEFYRKEEENA